MNLSRTALSNLLPAIEKKHIFPYQTKYFFFNFFFAVESILTSISATFRI